MSVIRAKIEVVRPYRCPLALEKPNCSRCVYNKGFIGVDADEWPSIQVLCVGEHEYEEEEAE